MPFKQRHLWFRIALAPLQFVGMLLELHVDIILADKSRFQKGKSCWFYMFYIWGGGGGL